MDQITNLKNLFITKVSLLHKTETETRNLLINVRSNVQSPFLQTFLNDQLERNELYQVSLQYVLEEMQLPVPLMDNTSVTTLINKQKLIMSQSKEEEGSDAAIIRSIQDILYYFISGYTTCCSYAQGLSLDEVEKLMVNILKEREKQNKILSRMASGKIKGRNKSSINIKSS